MTTFTPNPRRWWALAIIAIAQFMVIRFSGIIEGEDDFSARFGFGYIVCQTSSC